MGDDGSVMVGIVSSRPTLGLAINVWVPGCLARTSPDLDAILDLMDGDGIVIVDLVDVDRRPTLQALVDRGVATTVVAVLPVGWAGGALPGDPLTLAAPREMASLADVLAQARRARRAALAGGQTGRVGTEHVIDLTDHALAPMSWPVVDVDHDVAPTSSPVVDVDHDGMPGAPAGLRERGDEIGVGAVLRAWALLDEVDQRLGGASAVVAVRTPGGPYVIAAGTELAPFEAQRPIPADHPVLTALLEGPGWSLRAAADRNRFAGLPLAGCEHLLAVAVPGAAGRLDGVLLVGHYRTVDPRMAQMLAEVAGDGQQLDRRVRMRAGVASREAPAGVDGSGSTLPVAALPASWDLLGRLYPRLCGPSALLVRSSEGEHVVTAAQHLDASHALRILGDDHPLLQQVREVHGPVVVPVQPHTGDLVRHLPLPGTGQVAAFPVGDPAEPAAFVLVGRQEPLPAADQRWLAATIAEAGAPWQVERATRTQRV